MLSRGGLSTHVQKNYQLALSPGSGGLMFVGSAVAQTATSGAGPGVVNPGHPRVNEVNRRETN